MWRCASHCLRKLVGHLRPTQAALATGTAMATQSGSKDGIRTRRAGGRTWGRGGVGCCDNRRAMTQQWKVGLHRAAVQAGLCTLVAGGHSGRRCVAHQTVAPSITRQALKSAMRGAQCGRMGGFDSFRSLVGLRDSFGMIQLFRAVAAGPGFTII